jgi:hypothetical protein
VSRQRADTGCNASRLSRAHRSQPPTARGLLPTTPRSRRSRVASPLPATCDKDRQRLYTAPYCFTEGRQRRDHTADVSQKKQHPSPITAEIVSHRIF